MRISGCNGKIGISVRIFGWCSHKDSHYRKIFDRFLQGKNRLSEKTSDVFTNIAGFSTTHMVCCARLRNGVVRGKTKFKVERSGVEEPP